MLVAIIDYGMGNLDSVRRAVEECGGSPLVTCQREEIERANSIILPGVGAFPDAMRNIRERGLDEMLQEQTQERQIPLLGICLGMQLLSTKGLEFKETDGLGLIPGAVKRFEKTQADMRIPHVGWNEVYARADSALFKGIEAGKDFYFVHSYYFEAQNPQHVLATTPFGEGFASAVQNGLVFGVQFHPEKSQKPGFALLKNFLEITH